MSAATASSEELSNTVLVSAFQSDLKKETDALLASFDTDALSHLFGTRGELARGGISGGQS